MTEPAVLLQAAKLAESKGDKENADRLLEAILVEHPWSEATAVAAKQLDKGKATTNAAGAGETVTRIQVVDVDIPFTSLLWLFGKAAFAIVPAGVIAWLFWEALSSSLPGLIANAPFVL